MALISSSDTSSRSSSYVASSSSSRAIASSYTSPDTSPEIQYTGIRDLFQHIGNIDGDVLMVQNISFDDYALIKSTRDKRGQKFRVSLWSADSQLLIITIPTATHEQLHGVLDDKILVQLSRMNLNEDWAPARATEYTQMDNNTSRPKSAGEGDSARRPRSQRPGNKFPTLVIEARYSQSWNLLHSKARWWFEASNHAVKIVLLARLHKPTRQITIEKWKAIPVIPRPGAITRARGRVLGAGEAALIPDCVQTIEIKRADGLDKADPTSYEVTSGHLRLEFQDLFLRQPNQNEGDIVLDTNELRKYAVAVWEVIS